jgi:hypothetical protein
MGVGAPQNARRRARGCSAQVRRPVRTWPDRWLRPDPGIAPQARSRVSHDAEQGGLVRPLQPPVGNARPHLEKASSPAVTCRHSRHLPVAAGSAAPLVRQSPRLVGHRSARRAVAGLPTRATRGTGKGTIDGVPAKPVPIAADLAVTTRDPAPPADDDLLAERVSIGESPSTRRRASVNRSAPDLSASASPED